MNKGGRTYFGRMALCEGQAARSRRRGQQATARRGGAHSAAQPAVRAPEPGEKMRRSVPCRVRVISHEERIVEFTGSDESTDRYHTQLKGWKLGNYRNNPVFVWAHNYEVPPIGRALRVWTDAKTKELKFRIQFTSADLWPFGHQMFRMVAEGFLNAVSVGFIPSNHELRDDGTMDLLDNELLELSLVPVPANPNALVNAFSRGLVDEPFRDMFAVNAASRMTLADIGVEPAVAARALSWAGEDTASLVSQFADVKGEPAPEDPLVTAGRDLTAAVIGAQDPNAVAGLAGVDGGAAAFTIPGLDDNRSARGPIPYQRHDLAAEDELWDGTAEREGASLDDLRAMCTWFGNEGEQRADYLLPHHRRSDHATVWRGVAASMARLIAGVTEIPQTDDTEVWEHLAEHYRDFNKAAPDLIGPDGESIEPARFFADRSACTFRFHEGEDALVAGRDPEPTTPDTSDLVRTVECDGLSQTFDGADHDLDAEQCDAVAALMADGTGFRDAVEEVRGPEPVTLSSLAEACGMEDADLLDYFRWTADTLVAAYRLAADLGDDDPLPDDWRAGAGAVIGAAIAQAGIEPDPDGGPTGDAPVTADDVRAIMAAGFEALEGRVASQVLAAVGNNAAARIQQGRRTDPGPFNIPGLD